MPADAVWDVEGRKESSGHQESLVFQVEQAEKGECGDLSPWCQHCVCAVPSGRDRDKHAHGERGGGGWSRLGLKLRATPGPPGPLLGKPEGWVKHGVLKLMCCQ